MITSTVDSYCALYGLSLLLPALVEEMKHCPGVCLSRSKSTPLVFQDKDPHLISTCMHATESMQLELRSITL